MADELMAEQESHEKTLKKIELHKQEFVKFVKAEKIDGIWVFRIENINLNFRSKNTHSKPQKSSISHPTRGTFRLPRGALPRVGKALLPNYLSESIHSKISISP